MAHGGGAVWDDAVRAAAASIDGQVPTEVALGMANRATLSDGLARLAARGVGRVAVVRLFLSGSSFREQTLYYLGLSEEAPERFLLMGPGSSDPDARDPIPHGLALATHTHGLLTSTQARAILGDRARSESRNAARESVLFIAHGMGDEDENRQVLGALETAAGLLAGEGFARLHSITLREDWPEAREEAEHQIRAFVDGERAAGHEVIVIPARLFGFGPYAEVLGERVYRAGDGLLPHPAISDWIRETATSVACDSGWGPTLDPCPVVASNPTVEGRSER